MSGFYFCYPVLVIPRLTIAAESEEGTISIYSKTSLEVENKNLIVPYSLKEVIRLSINQDTRQLILYFAEKDPVEIENIDHPKLPWKISNDMFEEMVYAHYFNLKQLDDGSYKVDMYVPGLGGLTPEQKAAKRQKRVAAAQARAQQKAQRKAQKAQQRAAEAAEAAEAAAYQAQLRATPAHYHCHCPYPQPESNSRNEAKGAW